MFGMRVGEKPIMCISLLLKGRYYTDLTFQNCGDWLNSLCKLVTSHLIPYFEVYRQAGRKGRWMYGRGKQDKARTLKHKLSHTCVSSLASDIGGMDILQKLSPFIMESNTHACTKRG